MFVSVCAEHLSKAWTVGSEHSWVPLTTGVWHWRVHVHLGLPPLRELCCLLNNTQESPIWWEKTALRQFCPSSDQEVLHSVCREHLCIPGEHFNSFIYKHHNIFILFMPRTCLCCQASGQGPLKWEITEIRDHWNQGSLKWGITEISPLCVHQTPLIPKQMADADLNYKLRFIWNPIKGWGRQERDMFWGFFVGLFLLGCFGFFFCGNTGNTCKNQNENKC